MPNISRAVRFMDWMAHPEKDFRVEFLRSSLRQLYEFDTVPARQQYVKLLAERNSFEYKQMAALLLATASSLGLPPPIPAEPPLDSIL